ncbi:MAG: hypothetical protein ACFFAN_17540 [Promethearchaeota archaeon]
MMIKEIVDTIFIPIKKYKDWKPPSKLSKILWSIFGIIAPIVFILLLIYVGPIGYNFIVDLIA